MTKTTCAALFALLLVGCAPAATNAQAGAAAPRPATRAAAPRPATRAAYVAKDGVVRWKDDDREVRLFGANYALASSADYRAAGYLTQDRKSLVDQDFAQFARMGWDAVRLAFWGDWQNSDIEGNLIENDHLDVLDYAIAKARERGIYILFNPIHTYDAGWPDAQGDSFAGFAAHMRKDRLGTDSAAIAAQVNYIRQILDHVNPYTHTRLADEPAILFIEMINEPAHHPEDLPGSVRYIDALVDAVRSTGSRAITVHNVSQDFRIAPAIRDSKVQVASFGWYPAGLVSGHELRGSHLRAVDDYPPMRMSELAGLPRVVYEFDSADQLTGTMYPAMAREFRGGGVQLAAMFAYDFLRTASRNLGWQTHHLNLVYTPTKAMSAVIAAEEMKRLPRGQRYGPYPRDTIFGDFRLSPSRDLAELAAADAFLYTGSTTTSPPDPRALRRVAGHGSSPVVRYEGTGVYFLDRVREGVWRLEVYPDAVPVADPFEPPSRDRIVTRALSRTWPMTVTLADLGGDFTVQPVTARLPAPTRAADGRFDVSPGVWVLSAGGPVDRASLPATIGRIGFDEYHAPPADTLGPRVIVLDPPPEHVAGTPLEFEARVVTDETPDSVTFWLSPNGRGWYRPFPMRRTGAYTWGVTVPPDALAEGLYQYVVSIGTGSAALTFPTGEPRRPSAYDYSRADAWPLAVVGATTPLHLLEPGADVGRMSFSRIGDGWREGIFRILPSDATGEPVLHLELPVNVGGISPEDYTTSLFVGDRIGSRRDAAARASAVRVRLRGVGASQTLHVTLVERDGTAWSAAVPVDSTWTERTIPLSDLHVARGVKLPQGFPGGWNYWIEPAAGRGGAGDAIRPADVERLQLSLRREEGRTIRPGEYGVEVESVTMLYR